MMNLLVEYNPETDEPTDIRCDICSSWELTEDAMTYTFHVHPDTHWWDGVPVTSKDIWFNMESMVNPDQFGVLESRSTSSTSLVGLRSGSTSGATQPASWIAVANTGQVRR